MAGNVNLNLLRPLINKTVSASTSSVDTAIGDVSQWDNVTVRVASISANAVAFIRMGQGTQTATSADVAILPGEDIEFQAPPITDLHVACILASGSGTVYLTIGTGA